MLSHDEESVWIRGGFSEVNVAGRFTFADQHDSLFYLKDKHTVCVLHSTFLSDRFVTLHHAEQAPGVFGILGVLLLKHLFMLFGKPLLAFNGLNIKATVI